MYKVKCFFSRRTLFHLKEVYVDNVLYQPMPPRRGQVVRFGSSTTPPAVLSPPLHDGHPGVGQVEGSLSPVIGFTCFVKGLKLK